ncbi:ABC transporter ATP-binding protein [Bacillus sp. JCM 19034]|uniref:ABC transporter ATP-binding protein n=1 Tax=Bacillus sp. JCM 19034 TaxID=1481928 RepID=UPI000780D66B|nr:ABC transporter ATP-binding protein [Bacillus sp. JCM 19034]
MIKLENVSYTYPRSQKAVLNNISLSIGEGEIFGILGPSGAGKSTLQKLIIGVLNGYKGDVSVLHTKMNKRNQTFYQRLGVAFETPNFYERFTALENLQFFQSFYERKTERLEDMLAFVGLEGMGQKRLGDFSKGMKMRLNICRAFLHDPELVLLDEPTAGLDPVNVNKVMNYIQSQKSLGKTIMINTHNMQIAEKWCDRVAFIVDGEIKLVDSPQKLLEQVDEKKVCVTFRQDGKRIQKYFQLMELFHNETFQHLLKSESIDSIHTEVKTLEDFFIEVTGRSLQ